MEESKEDMFYEDECYGKVEEANVPTATLPTKGRGTGDTDGICQMFKAMVNNYIQDEGGLFLKNQPDPLLCIQCL